MSKVSREKKERKKEERMSKIIGVSYGSFVEKSLGIMEKESESDGKTAWKKGKKLTKGVRSVDDSLK